MCGDHLLSLELVHSSGIPYVMATMSKHLVSVLTTVNAPYSDQLDGVELAHCLADVKFAKQFPGQVSSFLGEVPVEDQISFAAEFGIDLDDLKAFASSFSTWSGESYKLAA
jgi:hypothetical protein